MTKIVPAYQIIIRAIHERGGNQMAAVREMAERRLWLSDKQAAQADLIKINTAPWYVQEEATT